MAASTFTYQQVNGTKMPSKVRGFWTESLGFRWRVPWPMGPFRLVLPGLGDPPCGDERTAKHTYRKTPFAIDLGVLVPPLVWALLEGAVDLGADSRGGTAWTFTDPLKYEKDTIVNK